MNGVPLIHISQSSVQTPLGVGADRKTVVATCLFYTLRPGSESLQMPGLFPVFVFARRNRKRENQKIPSGLAKTGRITCAGDQFVQRGRGCLCTLSALMARPSGSSRYPGVVSGTFICQQSITLGYSAIRYGKFGGMPCGLTQYRAMAFFSKKNEKQERNRK